MVVTWKDVEEVESVLPRQNMIRCVHTESVGGDYTIEHGYRPITQRKLKILFYSEWKIDEYVKFLNGQENTKDINVNIDFIKENVEFDDVYREGEYARFLVLVNPRLKKKEG